MSSTLLNSLLDCIPTWTEKPVTGGLPVIEFLFNYPWIECTRIEDALNDAWRMYASFDGTSKSIHCSRFARARSHNYGV